MNITLLQEQATALMRLSRWQDAVRVLKSLLDIAPDYEHGAPWYDLATCFDELGNDIEAKRYYLRALEYDATNSVFLGGLASLLYRHGTAEEALSAFTRYLDAVGRTSELGKKALPAIEELQRRTRRTPVS